MIMTITLLCLSALSSWLTILDTRKHGLKERMSIIIQMRSFHSTTPFCLARRITILRMVKSDRRFRDSTLMSQKPSLWRLIALAKVYKLIGWRVCLAGTGRVRQRPVFVLIKRDHSSAQFSCSHPFAKEAKGWGTPALVLLRALRVSVVKFGSLDKHAVSI